MNGKPRRAQSITGQRFGRLVVIEETVSRRAPSGGWIRQFRVRCDCGANEIVQWSNLRSGKTQSCGCIQREITAARNWKHGNARRGRLTAEYNIRCAMIQRCYNENTEQFPDYGGRGISVCARWRLGEDGKTGFECFLIDMGRRPSPKHSLDRKDNDGNYEPGNCRWTTRTEQRLNRRGGHKRVTVAGEEMPLVEACRRFGLVYTTANSRLKAGRSIFDVRHRSRG